MPKRWRIAGINFDHFHMGDLLRMAAEHADAEIVGVSDEDVARTATAVQALGIARDRVFSDYRACIERTRPDLVILCPATARHAEWTEKVAPFGVNILMEKPFAATLAEADRMIEAIGKTKKLLAINWPLRWVASHVTAKHLVDEGTIGELIEVHFYNGNRGPLYHGADKIEIDEEVASSRKAGSWFYQKEAGGGSLQDYLGYGTTLGTWFMNGRAPIEVTAVVDAPPGLEVDEHSIVVARYVAGLSKFETRWGTFTDPWTHQPQPRCGFVLVGRRGTISSFDYDPTVRIQTPACPEGQEVPVEALPPGLRNPVEYILGCLESGEVVQGPLSLGISRIGQQIVDTAAISAREKCTVALVG